MTFSSVLSGYEGLARKLATSAGSRIDTMLAGGGRRRIHIETTSFVLGGEAWPGAVPFGGPGLRR